MSLQNMVLNARNAKRSNSIRKESDTDKVTQQLEAILMESINVQNSGSKQFQVKALKELKQLRSDMITGQINAGAKSNQFVGVYSHVIDQLEDMTASTIETNSGLMDGMGSITNSMPSTDSLVAALMTANPIVGYGVKIMHDLAKGRREAKRHKKDEQKKRLNALKSQEEYVKGQLSLQDGQEELIDSQLEGSETKDKSKFGDVHSKLLTEIRDEIRRLEDAIKSGEGIIDEHLESVDDHMTDQLDQTADIEANAKREARLSRLDSGDDAEIPVVESLTTNAQSENKGGLGGLFGGAMGIFRVIVAGFMGFATSLGALFGFGAAASGGGLLAKMLTPIKSLIGFVFSIGKMVLSLGSKLLLPAAILLAIFDFFDGFFNAGEILGKSDSELSLGDRILVGISNIIARFIKIIDGVLEFFNIDIIDTTDLTKRIYEFFTAIPDMVVDVFNSLLDIIVGAFDWYVDKIKFVLGLVTGAFEWYIGNIVNTVEFIIDSVKSVMDKIASTFTAVYKGIEAKLKEWGESLSKIPGIGRFFKVEDEAIQLDPSQMAQVERDMKSLTSTANLLQVGNGTATMVPLASGSNSNGQSIQGAELLMQSQQQTPPSVMVNAPSNVSNNSKTINSTSNTSNPNSIHRRMNEIGYQGR